MALPDPGRLRPPRELHFKTIHMMPKPVQAEVGVPIWVSSMPSAPGWPDASARYGARWVPWV